jgi:hypothetical protein
VEKLFLEHGLPQDAALGEKQKSGKVLATFNELKKEEVDEQREVVQGMEKELR